MDAAALIAKLHEQRSRWVDLPGGTLRVQVRRPPETEFGRLRHGVTVDHVCEYVTGWSGFSEATLLGPAIGASDPLPFDPALWAAWVRDRADCMQAVASAIAEAVSQHLQAREAAAKNSAPSSTPGPASR